MPQTAAVQRLRIPLGVHGRQTGWVEVPITNVERGLALQRSLDGPGWHVVHVASGRLVTPAYRRKAAARATQRTLLALEGIDWTWSQTRFRQLAPAQQRQIVALVMERLGCPVNGSGKC